MMDRILCVVAAMLAVCVSGQAGTVVYEQDTAPKVLGTIVENGGIPYSIAPVKINQFDPSLGQLQNALITMFYLYNFDVTLGDQGGVAYTGAGGSLYLNGLAYSQTAGGGFLSGYDDSADGSYQMLLTDTTQITQNLNPDIFAQLQGTGTLEWSYDAAFEFDLSSSFLPNPNATETGSLTRGSVIISYQYAPATIPDPATPEPGSFVLAAAATVILLRAGKRRAGEPSARDVR